MSVSVVVGSASPTLRWPRREAYVDVPLLQEDPAVLLSRLSLYPPDTMLASSNPVRAHGPDGGSCLIGKESRPTQCLEGSYYLLQLAYRNGKHS